MSSLLRVAERDRWATIMADASAGAPNDARASWVVIDRLIDSRKTVAITQLNRAQARAQYEREREPIRYGV